MKERALGEVLLREGPPPPSCPLTWPGAGEVERVVHLPPLPELLSLYL